MTPRTLFIIILRILGILTLKELLSAIPQLLSAIILAFGNYSASGGLAVIFVSLITVAVYMAISYVLIFKAGYLVTKFQLDNNIEEPLLQFTISISSILRIAVIITGSLVLFFAIPEFCQIIYNIFFERNSSFYQDSTPDWSPAVFSGIKIILGLLIIGERTRILQFLEKTPASETKEKE